MIAHDVKGASKSTITSNDIVTAGQRALTNRRQRLETNLLIDDENSLHRVETIVNPTMQHSMLNELNHEPSRDANNGHFDSDPYNHAPDLSGNRIENPMKSFNLDEEKAVGLLICSNSLERCTLPHQKAPEDKPA